VRILTLGPVTTEALKAPAQRVNAIKIRREARFEQFHREARALAGIAPKDRLG
jgi:hypothetical protein